jgi:hypothetical protein
VGQTYSAPIPVAGTFFISLVLALLLLGLLHYLFLLISSLQFRVS